MSVTVRTKQLLVALTLCFFALPVAGKTEQILTVEANGKIASYTLQDLSNLPQAFVKTRNNYVDDITTFSGPTLRSILEQNGIGPNDDIELHALNDFFVSAPAKDAYNYNVILAILMNEKEMSVRDKGPIWVIYPIDEHPELNDDIYNGRLVWQLDKITLK
ncbi:putative pterin-binding protein [Sulfitobacter guttiformis]|uniref:Oxidoreductase molybdopterin-binding domain-containing protein n=1 Tax=Sulfitobacter guttiformis TaxID=74349 RepID=A0A420DRR0_9RHOB|nr:hypothetical protein [Sulfitobacter guttiformis]KIN74222.1 Oxidoreductase molybdopterin binding [Sulfitobacter guttiformis KCTC 32187]RKE96829.1 hypothetical protein C8N30_1401 [Sulfitobacter guttiformis]